jgi:NAD(P)-dependent dehydrogenase (short-subunit alcohol dehydrogenase family)
VGRRLEPLLETQRQFPGQIQVLSTDISTPEGREAVAESVPRGYRVRFLIHNAGVIEPVGPLSSIQLDEWRRQQAINVEAPLFLTQQLLEPLKKGGRVLQISTWAAHFMIPHWTGYCTSKAALHMIYMCLRSELQDLGIAVGSAMPGIVDTPILNQAIEYPPDIFPKVERYIEIKQEQQLLSPAIVAKFLYWLLTATSDDAFSEKEWDIYDTSHHAHWFGAKLPNPFE